MPTLPAHPSREHLRKEAKRLARVRGLRLHDAQREIANGYGFASWSSLVAHVDKAVPTGDGAPPLFAATRARDVAAVRTLLAAGENPNVAHRGETPLHVAARLGPLALVEALLEGDALPWRTDAQGRTPLEIARRGRPRERAAIIDVLDCERITDPSFRAAVHAIWKGDAATLARLLDREPQLLHVRNLGPDVYRRARRSQYFRDPKLLWYVAANPHREQPMPANIVEVAEVLLARGPAQDDLDYALELVMSSGQARKERFQVPMMRALVHAGARFTRKAIITTAAHGEYGAVRAAVDLGVPLDAPVAAALGETEPLSALLAAASTDDVQTAFGLAVIGGHVEAARLALDAGADVDARLPVHAHATALHQAAAADDVPMLELLLARGARRDVTDTLWEGTPLGWAIFSGRERARAVLERGAPENSSPDDRQPSPSPA